MALFPRGHGNKQLIYVICVFVALWWLGLISIGDPRNDGNQSRDLASHDWDRNEDEDQHGDGLVSWQPKASGIQNGQYPDRKQRTKHLPIIRKPDTTKLGKCKEKINFVYIKEIKCASQTLVNIFRRFGLERRLSIVTPIEKKLYLGWPWLIEDTYHRPSKTGEFNILCDHTVFDEDLLNGMMAPDTVFITSLREPFSQFKSMFNYYAFKRILNITAPSPMSEYLLNLDRYETIYTSPGVSVARYCIPDGFHMSKNLMAYNLGFPTGFLTGKPDMSGDEEFMKEWISYVSRKFYFVIIVEYFHESLVLLKRKMCWDLRDIVYFSKNVELYSFKSEQDQDLVKIYKKWSPVDHGLYEHFNRTFWKEVAEASSDFHEEVAHYNRIINDVTTFCNSIKNSKGKKGVFITVYGSQWNKPFDVTEEFCVTLSEDLLNRVQRMWDFSHPQMDYEKPNKKFC